MSKYDPTRHHRRSIRLRGYDYAQSGAYFVTIVTHERETLFNDPVLRRVAETMWQRIPRHFPNVKLGEWVVMPNHIHGIIIITGRGEASLAPSPPEHGTPHGSPTDEKRQPSRDASPQQETHPQLQPGSLGAIIGNFKSVTARRINQIRKTPGAPVWQRNYHERIIRDQRAFEAISEYIRNNPARWAEDMENPRWGEASSAPPPSARGVTYREASDNQQQVSRDASPHLAPPGDSLQAPGKSEASPKPRSAEHPVPHGQPTHNRDRAPQDASPQIVSLAQVRELAAVSGRTVREAELAALEEGIVPWRYVRNLGTVGLEGQAHLLRSTVAVVGLGGLGGYVAEALARMGVGRLILIDGDVFEEHNLNRQVLSTEERLGQSKAQAAKQRIAEINSAVEVTAHAATLTRENLPTLLAGADVVVDGLDRLPARLMLQEGAQALGIPMVHGSIAGFLGQVMTIFPGDPGLCALYGEAERLPEHGLEEQLGAPAATPMAVAAWEAQEVMKILTGKGEPLRNRLLVMDMESGTVETLQLG